ncbi:hypothetical protein SAMN05192529_10944 [Arachidicoccus rhizosphaerae]|uniref:Uncharacterized protein n=1 Tax=Arachidicoccus rhizosphaerae TaxID=551991 RepID=A0A1H3YTG5_9BACT|nr:hypothetical protein [Arachidicoccus rhizosphaerae]SEA14855.1 hypothetical protein SAMN05192529_10944 [Arachidicoccus rhizosphaerae]
MRTKVNGEIHGKLLKNDFRQFKNDIYRNVNLMNKKLRIKIDGKPVSFVDTVPESLSEALIKHVDVVRWSVVFNSVDLLGQKVENSECSFWKIDMEVPVAAGVNLELDEMKSLLFLNIGESVRAQFRPGEVFYFERGHQKTIQLPTSEISLFAGASRVRHEMILLDLKNGDRFAAEEAMLKALSGKSFN